MPLPSYVRSGLAAKSRMCDLCEIDTSSSKRVIARLVKAPGDEQAGFPCADVEVEKVKQKCIIPCFNSCMVHVDACEFCEVLADSCLQGGSPRKPKLFAGTCAIAPGL